MNEVEKKLWVKVKRYIPFLRFVPGVRMVAVCNSLAFGDVDEGSDVDLFVVAKEGKLFTVRILVTLFLHFCGVRRSDGKVAGRFCLSFFVDDSCLDLERIAIENDVYLACWLEYLVPVVDDGVFDVLLEKNRWRKDLLVKKEFERREVEVCRPNGVFGFLFGKWFERWMKKWQLKRAKAKMKTVDHDGGMIVDEHILKFHHNDQRAYFRDLWW